MDCLDQGIHLYETGEVKLGGILLQVVMVATMIQCLMKVMRD